MGYKNCIYFVTQKRIQKLKKKHPNHWLWACCKLVDEAALQTWSSWFRSRNGCSLKLGVRTRAYKRLDLPLICCIWQVCNADVFQNVQDENHETHELWRTCNKDSPLRIDNRPRNGVNGRILGTKIFSFSATLVIASLLVQAKTETKAKSTRNPHTAAETRNATVSPKEMAPAIESIDAAIILISIPGMHASSTIVCLSSRNIGSVPGAIKHTPNVMAAKRTMQHFCTITLLQILAGTGDIAFANKRHIPQRSNPADQAHHCISSPHTI